jgi:isocitrate dehydrogenase (NAD+)
MSAVMMLRDLGETDAAARVENALLATFKRGKTVTRDLGGEATTAEFVQAVIGAMSEA